MALTVALLNPLVAVTGARFDEAVTAGAVTTFSADRPDARIATISDVPARFRNSAIPASTVSKGRIE